MILFLSPEALSCKFPCHFSLQRRLPHGLIAVDSGIQEWQCELLVVCSKEPDKDKWTVADSVRVYRSGKAGCF